MNTHTTKLPGNMFEEGHFEGHHFNKRRVHDGIVGVVITLFTALGYYTSQMWLLVPAVLGITLMQSALTGFCPLYFTLDKIQPDQPEQPNH